MFFVAGVWYESGLSEIDGRSCCENSKKQSAEPMEIDGQRGNWQKWSVEPMEIDGQHENLQKQSAVEVPGPSYEPLGGRQPPSLNPVRRVPHCGQNG
jgi:hypothetical protein